MESVYKTYVPPCFEEASHYISQDSSNTYQAYITEDDL